MTDSSLQSVYVFCRQVPGSPRGTTVEGIPSTGRRVEGLPHPGRIDQGNDGGGWVVTEANRDLFNFVNNLFL